LRGRSKLKAYQPGKSLTGNRKEEMEEKLNEKILQPANLSMACREVVRNKGAGTMSA